MKLAASLHAAATGVARHRMVYPALRLRPSTQRSAIEALAELGIDRHRLVQLNEDFARAADELFPQLVALARSAGEERFAAKLEDRGLLSHESKRLVYLGARAVGARTIVETGTFSGALSTFLLRALADGGGGRLFSFDLPARAPIPHAIDVSLPSGRDPGWIVPGDLADRLELVLGDTRETLRPRLAEEAPIDIFVHDSLHTTRHMLFEYRAAWQALRPGGILISDDIFLNPAFWWFTRRHRLPFLHIGNVGVTRKPGGSA